LSHHQGLTVAAHLPPSPRHSPKSAAIRLSHPSQEPAPVHTYVERRHARQSHRRLLSPPQDVPELQPISPASSSSSSSDNSSVGPHTPESMDVSPVLPSKPAPATSKHPLPTRKVLGLDASQFQNRTIEIIRRFPQIPRVHT
jgi:hypothetical protein